MTSRKVARADCSGCRNDFYNAGNNNLGITECHSFKTAKLVPRISIGLNDMPPYIGRKPNLVPHCRREVGRVLVSPDAIGRDGYWKR